METYELAELTVRQGENVWNIAFERAKLFVIPNYGTLSWYVEVDGMSQVQLLEDFASSLDIEVYMEAATIGGKALRGEAFFHPNPGRHAAAIRGQGELIGYTPNPASR